VVEVSHVRGTVRVVGESRAAVARLHGYLCRQPVLGPARMRLKSPPEPGSHHAKRIRLALDLIRRGDLYQVNLARRFELQVEGHPFDLLASLGARGRFPYAVALRLAGLDLVGTSPELFLRLEPNGQLSTTPIKGTRPRGDDPDSDRRNMRELEESEKERAELTMVLDVERNDLGRLAVPGSVRLVAPPRVTTHPTLHHRGATLQAQLRPGWTHGDVLRAMLPSGSVTGAPKRRAMEVIASLEPHRRGLYTGALGMVAYDGGMTLGMAIRTLTVENGTGHYFAGGGIVADSDPEAEVLETDWKGLQLLP
jgi:anthranilate/para-aminobenzoate synthase component I